MWKIGTFTIAAALIACTEAEPLGEVSQPVLCPTWQCGTNSPVVEFRSFHELSELGVRNAEGYRITGFANAGINYQLDVTDGRLRGVRGSLVMEGAALAGATIFLDHVSGSRYALHIDEVSNVDAWATIAGVPPTFETYLVSWASLPLTSTTQWRNLCPSPAHREDALGLDSHFALVFEGDRINAQRKLVGATQDPSWFNIGCAGHALAKLALSGHTHAGNAYGFATSPLQRQAMLKQIVADYCGTGQAFTIAGTPLTWSDAKGYNAFTAADPTLEARWTPNGASCLDTPRALASMPDVEADIASTCVRPPACSDPDPTVFDGAHVISAVP